MVQRRWLNWLAVFLLWTLLGLGFSFLTYSSNLIQHSYETWWTILSYYLANAWLWVAFSAIIFQLAGRFPIDRQNWPFRLLLFFPLSFLAAFLHSALFLTIYELVDQSSTRMYHSLIDIYT